MITVQDPAHQHLHVLLIPPSISQPWFDLCHLYSLPCPMRCPTSFPPSVSMNTFMYLHFLIPPSSLLIYFPSTWGYLLSASVVTSCCTSVFSCLSPSPSYLPARGCPHISTWMILNYFLKSLSRFWSCYKLSSTFNCWYITEISVLLKPMVNINVSL